MITTKFIYRQDEDGEFLGYLYDYRDHWTQGEMLQDVKERFCDLREAFVAGMIPRIKKAEELELMWRGQTLTPRSKPRALF